MSASTGRDGTTERLFTGYSGRLSLVAAAGWLAILLGREALPPLLPAIVEGMGIAPSQAGVALTAMFAVYSLAHHPGGRLSDRLSRRTVLVGSLVVAMLGFVLLATTRGYVAFLAALLLVGVGAGAYLPATRGLLSDLFEVRRGQAFGVQMSAGSAGSSLAAGVAVVALAVAGWRAAFLPSVVLMGVVALAFHRWSREQYVVERVSLGVRSTAGRLRDVAAIRWVVVAYSLFAVCWMGVLGFLPTFLQAEKELSPVLASAGFAGLYLAGMIVTPLAGRASDRFRPIPVAITAVALAVVGLLAMLAAPTLPVLALAIVVYGAGTWSFPPVVQSYVLGVFPPGSRAGDFGAVKLLYTLVGSLGPTYVGVAAERAGYTAAFAGFVPCLVLSAGVLAWLIVSGRS